MLQIARRALHDVHKYFEGNDYNFALNCAHLMVKRGIPRPLVSLLTCDGGHTVCGFQTASETWILDMKEQFMYAGGTWTRVMTFDKPGEWHSV